MFKIVAITLLVALSGANASFWSACSGVGSNVVAPTSITSPSCVGDRCTVTRGQTLIANAVIPWTAAHQRLDVTILVFILGIGIPVQIDPQHANACNSLVPGCPTVPGQSHTWTINMPVTPETPAANNVRVRCELLIEILIIEIIF